MRNILSYCSCSAYSHSPMPRRSPSQQRSKETVDAIVEAAAQVFERHGYAAGTTNRIAERAGVSIGTLYQYFADKDAVLTAVVERHVAEGTVLLLPALARMDDDPPPAPEDVLREVLGAMVALHARDPNLHRLLFEETPLPAQFRTRLAGLQAEIAARVEAWLRRHGTSAESALAAWVIVQSVEALTHRWVLEPPPGGDDDAFVREAARMLAAGL